MAQSRFGFHGLFDAVVFSQPGMLASLCLRACVATLVVELTRVAFLTK